MNAIDFRGTSSSVPVTQRVLGELRAGKTVKSIACATGLSEVFVATLLEHYGRLGVVHEATSLCSSGLGACHTTELSDEARISCAGCPLTISLSG